MNRTSIIKTIKYLASLIFAFGIIYLLFKNQDPIKLLNEIRKVEGKWIILSMIFGAWAYVSRGLRWKIMLDAINYKSSNLNNIAAVSIGYFTNLFIPRAGEISRCTALNQSDKIPINKLFGTIVIERVIDFIALLLLLLLTFAIKSNAIHQFYLTIQGQRNTEKNYLAILIVILVFFITIFLLRKLLKKSTLYIKLLNFIEGLKEGFKSVQKIKNKSVFWFHTLTIWIMYFLMTYICFFSMEDTYHLTISDGVFLLVLGGVGMIIPTPGGIGSYHAIVMIGLSILGVGSVFLGEGGDPKNPALIFPTIVHVAQTLVAIIMGLCSLLFLFLVKQKND